MKRRKILLGAAGFACSLAPLFMPGSAFGQGMNSPSRQAAIAAWKRRIHSILDRGRLPIIDAEATYVEGATDVSRIIGLMNELDVAQIAFAPANAPDSTASLELYRQHPEYFIPTSNSGEFNRWWRDPLAFLSGVSKDHASGAYFLMGEYEFRHYPSPEQVRARKTERDISIDIDGLAGDALFALSTQSGSAFQLHYEIEDRLLAPLESMLGRYPKATVIWCHLGMIRYPERARRYNPGYVNGLIERFPGLHFDLAVPPPGDIYQPSGALHSTLYSAGRLNDGWKELIEKHPQRFLCASDYRPAVADHYPDQILRQRRLILAALSAPARQLVAYQNAWRLITGTAWGQSYLT